MLGEKGLRVILLLFLINKIDFLNIKFSKYLKALSLASIEVFI